MPRYYDDTIDTIQYGVLHIGSNTAKSVFRITSAIKRTYLNDECDVCGEPIYYSPYHICNRCRVAAQKFKDCLTEEELGKCFM